MISLPPVRRAAILTCAAVVACLTAACSSDNAGGSATGRERPWSTERITSDPKGYLEWCEREGRAVIVRLTGVETRFVQQRRRLLSRTEELIKRAQKGESALGELKMFVQQKEAENAWPAPWAGESRTHAWCLARVDAMQGEIDVLQGRTRRLAALVVDCDKGLVDVRDALADERQKLDVIDDLKLVLDVEESSKSLRERLLDVRGPERYPETLALELPSDREDDPFAD